MKTTIITAAVSLAIAAPATASDDTVSLSPVVVLPAGTQTTDGRTLVEPLSTDQEEPTTVRVVDGTGQESDIQVDIVLPEGSGPSDQAGAEQ